MTTETTDYQKQGTEFLAKHGMKLTAKFLRHAPYFPADKESRDIFRLTLTREDGKRYPVAFGQSTASSTGTGGHVPTPYDLLTCITKSGPGSFEDFCSEFGYDNDSRKAELAWKRVVKDWAAVSAFFSEEELIELQEIN